MFSGANMGVTLAAIAALFPIFQFFLVRRRESQDREFKVFHSLIEQLVSAERLYIDRQIAVVFELRHFKRYFECTERILLGMKETLGEDAKGERLFREMDLTLAYIRKRRRWRRGYPRDNRYRGIHPPQRENTELAKSAGVS